MFKVFGEFDAYEEINEAAEGLRQEGDFKNIAVLAEENGIDKELAELYISGQLDMLCDIETAAIGKIEVEAKELKNQEIMQDWVEYIKACVSKDEKMARAVRRKGKSVKKCIANLLIWSMKHMYPVDAEIVKAAGAKGQCKLGIPGMATAKELIRKYYLGK